LSDSFCSILTLNIASGIPSCAKTFFTSLSTLTAYFFLDTESFSASSPADFLKLLISLIRLFIAAEKLSASSNSFPILSRCSIIFAIEPPYFFFKRFNDPSRSRLFSISFGSTSILDF